jgi:hypothetical protein
MNIYPKNEYVNIYDSRPQVPAGYESETRPLMPPSSKSYNEADMTPKASSGGFFRGLGKSNSSSQGNLRGLMQSGSRENIAPRSTVTPQRGLLQPIQPPLPRSQTLGNLLVCGSGNAGGRPSSELDHRNARERFYKSIGLKGSTSSVFSSKKGTHGSTSEQFEHSSSTDTLGNQETAQKYTRRNDLRGNLVYMPSMEVLAGSNEDKWVMVDGFEHREVRNHPVTYLSRHLSPYPRPLNSPFMHPTVLFKNPHHHVLPLPSLVPVYSTCSSTHTSVIYLFKHSHPYALSLPPLTPARERTLTPPLLQISKAMPTNFWLGRFVTLSDRFHHSDDEVILNNPSSSSGIQDQIPTYDFSHSNAHLLSDDDEEDNPAERRRVQRVFMTLTKVCSTEEARKSLHVFWKEYARKFGFPGPNSMMRMGGLSASTSVSSGLNIKAAAGDSQSVRSGLNVTAAAGDAQSVRSVLSERPSVRSGLNVSAAAGVGGGGASVRSGLSERPSVSSGLNVSAAAGVGVGLRQGKDAAAGIVGLGHGQPATPASVRLGETETAAFGGPGLGEEKPAAPRVGLGQGKEKESEAPAPTPAPTPTQVQTETQKQKGKEPLKEVKSCEGLSAGVGEGGKGSVRKGMFSRLRGLRRSLAGSDE